MPSGVRTPEKELDRQIKVTKTYKKKELGRHETRMKELDQRIEELTKKRNAVPTTK